MGGKRNKMKGSSASYSKKKKWLIGAMTPAIAVCLAAGLLFMSATDGLEPIAYAASEFNNIVNANIGMHPKWIEETCISAKDGGVGDTYTNKHKVWHADVTRAKYDASDPDAIVDRVGNDVVMEKSPAYVFTGSETNADKLAAEYSLKAGNEVVFNITDGDSAAKVWADAVAFAQSLGTPTLLADPTLAGTVVNGEKTTASCNGTGDENHNGFRVGTNTGNRNEYQGNFFINNDDGALGQYIIVRLQDDWTAKSITTTAPTNVSGQTVTNKNTYGANDYLSGVTGASSSITTTSFNYVTNDGNNTPNVFGEGTYLPTETSADGFTRIDSNDDGYVISWDLASNSCDYDGTQEDGSHNVYGYIYNDNCAFSYGRINVPTGVYIVLDLNGHKIDRALAGGGNYYGSVFHIDSKARLEIMDSTAYENASSARIEGTNAAGQDASGTAHTTNHGGTITGGNVEKSKKLNLPVTLQANLQSSGGGFNLSMWADLVVHSGTISNNKNSESGGAFYQRSKAAVTVFDGYVLDNEAASGGVTNLGSGSGCPFTMYGGVLAYNKSSGNGGAVNLARSSYGNFHGGEIMYNEAKKSGGGIALDGNSLGILDSVTISNNLATTSGGGVYVPAEVGAVDAVWRTQNGVTDHAFKFRGSLQVRNNKHGSSFESGTTDNVYLGYDTVASGYVPGVIGETLGRQYTGYPKIGIGGPLIANGIVANVGVTLGDYGDPIFTSGYGANGNNAVDTFLYFFSDNNNYSVTNTGTSREATMGRHDAGEGGLTWLIEGTGVDADTNMESETGGESTIKIVIHSDEGGSPTFYYKNPSNTQGFGSQLKLVEAGSKMNKAVKKSDGETSTDNLLEILQDRFKISNGSLDFEYSMLKVTKISAYTGSPSFTPSGDNLTQSGGAFLKSWECKQEPGGEKPTYTVNNTFDNANFHFKMGEKDLTATAGSVTEDMQNAISATDGSISYAGEYSVLVSGARYDNPSFKIKINQVGVRVDRALYYNGQKIGKGETLDWTKPWIDWNGDDNKDEGNDPTKANEVDQPYFIYSGDYYYPILSADYNAFSVFRLYNPYATEGDGYSSVAKSAFTGYVLDFTYANEYFGTNQPVRFGSHSGGGIEYQTMHRQPNSISGTGTYVPGVKNAGMYEVQFISSRSAASADENDADHKATGVYFAANNFAFSSKVNIYVDPASAEVELTTEAKEGFTYDAGEIKDAEIVIYDNTSNTHVNPHLDAAAVLEYFLFDDLNFKAGVYDIRTKLYYTLDQVKDWENNRPWGSIKGEDDTTREAAAKEAGKQYIPSYTDEELQKPPEVLWDSKTGDKFDPANPGANITEGILDAAGLKAFQALYEKTVDLTSDGKLVYIVDQSSFSTATKLEGNPTDARRYAVFVTLDLDVGYDDYNYNFDQNADHLVGLGKGTSYFWAFEFTVNPAEVRPYDFDDKEKPNPIPGPEDKNTSVGVQREVVFNGLGQFQLPTLNFTDPLGMQRALTGSAAEFTKGGTTFGTGLYSGSALTVQEGYDFIVKYYIEEYGLTEAGKYLDYVNVMNGQKLKVRIYIPAYKDATTGKPTGANGNYVFDGKALGDARKDDEGNYYYEITYTITPVTVTTSLTITYTYDGTSREEDYKPSLYNEETCPEQGGTVGMGVGGVWTDKEHGGRPANKEEERQQGFIYPFSVWRDNNVEAEEGTAVGPKVGEDKLKYTISNPQWLFSDTTYQSNENIKFGGGVYTFNTGSPNVGQYALSTVTKLGGGDLKTHHNYEPLEIDTGVVWVFTFSNSNDTDFKFSRQGFNGTADENGNYGNFVVGDTSTVTVIIEAKNIADENVFATKIQQAKDGSALPDSATEGGALAIYGDGYADIAYTTEENGAVVQDTAATKDGKYKMATFPFAGPTTYYRPHVKLGYYKYGVNGATSTETRGDTVTTIEEGPDFTLGWADNSMASVTSENAVGLSGTSAGQFASVIVNAQGNYTGSVTVNFYIRPAVIAIAHNGGAYDFKKGDEGAQYNGYYYDRGAHGLQLTFTNTEDYRPYTRMLFNARGTELSAEQVEAINTNNNIDISNVAYAYASQELFDAFHKKYFDDGKVDDKELEELNKLYSVDPPIDADVYYAAIALSNENFVFKEAKEGEEFPSITGSNFGNGTNDLVRGVFEIKPATVTATIDAAAAFYNRSAHTASFSFTNERDGNVTPSTVLNEYEVTYLLGGQTEMIDAGTYTVTVTFGTHDWLGEGNIDDGMKSGIEIPTTTKRSNFVFNATADKTRTFDFTIKPAEIKLGKFADVAYNKVGQGVPLDFTNTERNNDAVPTLAATAEEDLVTANEYTLTYEAASKNAKLDGSKVPLNAGDYNVTVALTDAAKSKADPSLYNFKFVATAGVEQTIDADGKTVSSSYTITPATVNASVENTTLTYNGQDQKQNVKFENALGEDSIIPEFLGQNAELDGVEYSVKYAYSGFAGKDYAEFINRGSYTVTVTLKNDGNYTFGKRGEAYLYSYTISYAILPKDIEDEDVTLSETPSELVYTGASLTPTFTLTATKILDGYKLIANSDYSVTHTADVDVYYAAEDKKTVVTVTINGQNNFSGTKTFTFTILPAKVSVTANEGTGPEGTITAPYNKFAQALAFTFQNKEADGTVVPVFSQNDGATNYKVTYKNQDGTDTEEYTQTNAPINAGTYTVTVTLTGLYAGGNFTFEDGSLTKTFTLVITPAELTLTISESFAKDGAFNKSFVYDGQDYYSRLNNFTLNNVNNTVPNGSAVTEAFYLGTYSTGALQTNFMNAGTYYILFTFTGEQNVNKNYSVTAIKAGKDVALENVTDYTVQADGSIVIPFTITPAQITVNALSNKTYTGEGIDADILFTNKVSGGVVPNNSKATYTAVSANAKLADGSNLPLNAGKYTVTVTLEGDDANNFTIADGTDKRTFTVDPAIISASVEAQRFTYDGEKHQQTVKFANALGEGAVTPTQDEYRLDYTYDGFSEREKGEFTDRGSYGIAVDLNESGNFAFGKDDDGAYNYHFDISYSILPKEITKDNVTGIADGESKTYTSESLTPTDIVIKTTLKEGSGEYTLIDETDYTLSHSADVEAFTRGAQTVVKVTITCQNNFSGTLTYKFTIDPAVVSVAAAGEDAGTVKVTYNRYAQPLDLTFTNTDDMYADVVPMLNRNGGASFYTVTYKNQDSSDETAYTQTNAPKDAGTYLVTITLGKEGQGNFTFDGGVYTKTYTLLIEKAKLTLTISELFANGGSYINQFVYDGKDYYNRLNTFDLDNDYGTVPVGSEIIKEFYLGIYPADGDALTKFSDAGQYYILFAFKKGADKDVSKNYEVAAVWAGSSAVELKGDNYTTNPDGSIVIPFEITRAKITVNALSNKTYTGMNIEADILFTNVSDGSDVVPGGGDYTVKYAAADLGDLGDHVVDAGKYTVTVTLTDPVEKNFEIVAWDDAGTMTREFTVDPAKLSVVLRESVVDYSGSNYIVQTNFTNTSETAIVPTKIGEDYSLALVATDDPGLTPEYNAVIDAKTYNVTVTLLNDNFVFTDDGMTTTLTYTINPGTIELSDPGTKMTNSWKTASYNPSNLIRTKFVAGDFSLVGNRSTDIAGMNITLISCTTDDGSYTMGDGYYEIEKRGTYKVTIQVSAPNHTTRTFTFDINVTGGNVLINVPEDFSNFLTKQYGMEYGDVGLQEAFLDLIKGGSLTVDNIPNPEIKEKSGQAVVDWLLDFGFTVKVDGSTFSTSNHLKVGDYALKVSLPDVDGGIRFHEESNDSQVVTSNTRFYHITPAVIVIDWGALSELKYSGRDQSDSIKGGVKIANLLAGDVAGFEIGHILIGTKADAFAEADEVVDAVQAGTEDLIRYYLRLRVDDATLTGDDKANYVFATDGKVDGIYFEKDFNIARLELNILLSNSSSYYGNDYTENFAFTYMDANGSASVDVDEVMLRKAVLEVLKLYLADVEVEAEFPGVNTYKVKATTLSSDFGNFKLEFGTAEATHEINRRPVALQMASSESIYGEATVLPDKNHSWTTSAGSLSVLDGDLEQIREAIAISTNATTDSPVSGIYTTSGTVIPNATSGNYEITCADGVYTIKPRPIVIDITNRQSVYGEPLDDNLTDPNAWKVSAVTNTDAEAGDLNYGLRATESNAMLEIVLSLNPIYTDSPTCNRDGDGNIIAWPNAITGTCSNNNYEVTAWKNGDYLVKQRQVSIQINNRTAVYGDELARMGSPLTLREPLMNGDNTAVVTPGDWTYDSSLGSATYTILPVDMSYLTFYVGKADTKSETAYAYVGKYPLVGAWAFGFDSSSVSYCYKVTFTGTWEASLNEGTAFEGAQDGAAGVYEITPASITEEGSWNVNKLFYETSDPNKTEENGWFKMYLEQMLFSLKGDFNAPLADITPSSFTYSEDGSEAGKTTAFTALLPVNGKDETLTITFAKPQYRGIGSPTSEEPYYNEGDHLWYVHTGGRWSSAVTVSVANHTDATFTLTYIISNVIATVSLNSALGALEAVYGDYKYPALAADLENYDENDIKDLPLSQALNEYIFENSSMIITVTGFETAFPESTLEDHVREIVNNCWVEVADAQISSGGYLMAGTYTLRLVAREGSGFFANFKASSASLPKGQVDQGAGNRLVIRPREIGIDWVDPAAAKRDEIIREDSDKITYTYSGYEYSQQPTFTNILPGDLVSDPAYQFLTETGAVVDTAKNVRKDGYYTIQVLQSALKGADSVNYRLPDDMTIRLDIIPREIYITIDDLASTVYGVEPDLGRVFTADDWHVTTGKGLGLAAGETTADLGIELHLELPSKDAALYVNAVKGEGNNDNYEFRFEGGNYEITPKSIHINIEDKESFYGDEFVALGFTVDGALAYDDTADDLLVVLAKASGLDVGDYAITGVSGNPNYVVTFTDGTYTILRATNVWMREFEAFEFFEGENPPEDQKPLARFGEVHLYYFYDEACTEIVLDDISELDDGVYYVRAVVAGTDNYTALDNMYTFTILPTFSTFGNNMDIGLYVTIWSIQVVALLGAVLFVRRRKQKNGTKKS